MMKVDVVYHVLAVNHWQAVVREQLDLLLRNQLIRSILITFAIPPAPVLMTASGQPFTFAGKSMEQRLLAIYREVWSAVAIQARQCPPGGTTVASCAPEFPDIERCAMDECEHPAMRRVEALARSSDELVLYCHAKGVSYRPPEPRMEHWRMHMNQLLADVDGWARKLTASTENVAGPCLLRDEQMGISYFAGNFWMAKSAYLRELADYQQFLTHPPTGWHEPGSRFLAELAINRGGRMLPLAIDGRTFSSADVRWLD